MQEQNQVQYAGFWIRFLSVILDGLLLLAGRIVFFGLILLITYSILNLFDVDPVNRMIVYYVLAGISVLVNFWLTWVYYAKMESSRLQATVGKLIMGVQVCDLTLQPITFDRATVRYFAKWVSSLTIAVGYLMIAFAHKKQGLHDHIASTLLVIKRHRY